MSTFPIGIILESLKQTIPQALDTIRALGAQGLQAYATYGELSPDNLTPAKKKEFKSMVDDRGLVISALCGDLGHGFGTPEKNPALIEKSKRILDLAKEWGSDIVTTHIGVVPSDPNHPRYRIMQDACGELAAYADSMNSHFAIETGPETSQTLVTFLDSLHSNLWLSTGPGQSGHGHGR